MTENTPDLELSTARVLRAVAANDPTALGEILFKLEQANVAGLAVVAFAQLYVAECLKTTKRDTILRAAEAQVARLSRAAAPGGGTNYLDSQEGRRNA